MTGRPTPCQPALARGQARPHVIGMAEKDRTREERLAAALRENLRRRKAQARDLANDTAQGAAEKDGDAQP